MYNSDRRNSPRQSSQYRRQSTRREDDYLQEEAVLPRNRLRSFIIINLIGGLLVLAIPIVITLANASLFSQAARPDQSMPLQVAILVSLWSLGGNVIAGLVIAFVVGMITGQIAAKRWLVRVARAFPGACIALYYILTPLIPNYPGHISSGTTSTPIAVLWGLVFDAFMIAAFGLIGTLMSRWGALFRTPKTS